MIQPWLPQRVTFTSVVTKSCDGLVLFLQRPPCVLAVTSVRRVRLCHAKF